MKVTVKAFSVVAFKLFESFTTVVVNLRASVTVMVLFLFRTKLERTHKEKKEKERTNSKMNKGNERG